MKLVKSERLMFTDGLIDLTYVCDRCKTVTRRTIKGD